LTKADGTSIALEEVAEFVVLEFNRNAKRITVSHTRTYEEAPVAAAPKERKPRTGSGGNRMMNEVNSNVERSTFGDLDVLSALKEQMDDAPAAKEEAPAAKEEAPAAKEEAPSAKEESPAAKEEAPSAKEEAPAAKEKAPAKKAPAKKAPAKKAAAKKAPAKKPAAKKAPAKKAAPKAKADDADAADKE
jgi:hypothetical protein